VTTTAPGAAPTTAAQQTPTLDAIASETAWRGALEPGSLDEVRALAKSLRGSCAVPLISRGRGPDNRMLPKEAMAEADIVGLLMLGRSLGLGTMQSLNGIYIVEGRPTLAAQTMLALVRRSPHCEAFDFETTTEERCVVMVKRRGSKSVRVEWTIEMGRRAGAFQRQSSPWVTYPQAMLRARAISDACRMMFGDVILGLYSSEEMADSASERVLAAVDVPGTVAAVERHNAEEDPGKRPDTWLAQMDAIARSIALAGLSTVDAAVVRTAFAHRRNEIKPKAPAPPAAIQTTPPPEGWRADTADELRAAMAPPPPSKVSSHDYVEVHDASELPDPDQDGR
jgi:RecT family